ncbi:histidine phosphatase superfamily [Fimicolochytrium jonesii]|uniref:histidine phosphatase superfamily n=1 Tax=Fimicolochytrium jonesii TaxID=1396493 RepID=UPI0022FE1CBC|nr:histidine phosphatase superfamily [Fimicolochytrium jonesii]KAI8821987.1 histidine phosphatase superfamily [Fimicolochytrium jonesii]
MHRFFLLATAAVSSLVAAAPAAPGVEVRDAHFNPLEHLGGNSPFFAGPNVFGIDPEPPANCVVDQAAFTSRHGSRYPDPGAWDQWNALRNKIQAANFTVTAGGLNFLHTWKPVVRTPSSNNQKLSITGWKELHQMGTQYRFRYDPSFFDDNGMEFHLWANQYPASPRVIDSARLFAQGYLGPNATAVGHVHPVASRDPRSIANSLAASDLCLKYVDNGGGEAFNTFAATYLPQMTARLNSKIRGGFNFTTADVYIMPYLCGFETQITGKRSPWCGLFAPHEFEAYEYAQDLRYYFGHGPGNRLAGKVMLPFLSAVIDRFVDGPDATYTNSDGSTFKPNKLIATFTNDGNVNQIVAASGIFDDQAPLPGDAIPRNRIFRATRYTSMRGTITFERLNCGKRGLFVRAKLNDAVYPIAKCQNGPDRSCKLSDYQALLRKRLEEAGPFQTFCGVVNSTIPVGLEKTTFLKDITLPFEFDVKP